MARLPRPDHFVAPKYMTRFSCLGPECEDTCCQWWLVAMEKDDYTKMKKTMATDRDGTANFKRGVKRLRGEEKGEWFATIRHRDDGFCTYLTDEKTCEIHRDHGEKALCYTCATYPRSVTLVGRRIELTGTLSCPEISRLALLADDAMELQDVDPDVLPRKRTIGAIDLETDDPYFHYFDDIRATLLGVTAQVDYPVATRLFFAAYFANRLEGFFGSNHPAFSAARLADEVDRIGDVGFLEELQAQFHTLALPEHLSADVIQQLLAARMARGAHHRFTATVRELYFQYLKERAEPGADDETVWKIQMSAADVWAVYRKRAVWWESRLAPRLDRYITNFCFNYWIKSWYTNSASLLHHVRRLLILVTGFRFLLFGDPALVALMNTPPDSDAELQTALDAAAVKASYALSRNVEHHRQFLTDVDDALNKAGITSFAHVVCLLKI